MISFKNFLKEAYDPDYKLTKKDEKLIKEIQDSCNSIIYIISNEQNNLSMKNIYNNNLAQARIEKAKEFIQFLEDVRKLWFKYSNRGYK